MADNLNIDAGSTLTVATDDISGVHYQVIKVAHGAPDAATHSSAAAPFPVTVISATLGTVTISGNVNVATATLGTVTITGTVTPSTTAATITNAVGNPVNVSLTSTVVTVKSAVAGFNVNVATATLGTVTVTGTVTPSTTAATITNAAGNPVNVALTATAVTVSNTVNVVGTGTAGTAGTSVLTVQGIANGTAVPISSSSGFNVNVATATLGTVTISGNVNIATATLGTVTVTGTVTPSTTASTITNAAGNPVNVALTATGVTVSIGRTLTSTSGFLNSVTAGTLVTGSARIKVYGFSLTTTFAGEVICVFHTGGLELWRVDLAPGTSGSTAGANLATSPPGFLFASRSGTAVTLSLSTAAIVHYSLSYFDEA